VDGNGEDRQRESTEGRVTGRTGFTVVELLVAGALALVLMAGVLAVVDPGQSTSKAQVAAIDIQQRLRAASEVLSADVHSAGSGPVNGAFGKALGIVTPAVLPFRTGPRGDAVGTARADAISLITSAGSSAAVVLGETFAPASGVAQIAPAPGCPVGDESCGIRAGAAILVLDGRGQSDLFIVTTVNGRALGLEARGATSGRPFPPGSLVIPVTVSSYYLRQGTAAEGVQLMSGDGGQADLPLIDHVAGFSVALLGDPQPPRLGLSGASVHAATYGPLPPPLGVDDGRDGWPAGENCTFLVSGGVQRSRMAVLGTGAVAGPVPLAPALLTDGPWCPDGSASWRYDADLLRVRAVRITVRAEATSAMARGADSRLFVHPGTSRDPLRRVADQQVVLDVVPRALQAGR
jgi:type II secretory pathway pseudopilin PulG